jgi:hypothetical protein
VPAITVDDLIPPFTAASPLYALSQQAAASAAAAAAAASSDQHQHQHQHQHQLQLQHQSSSGGGSGGSGGSPLAGALEDPGAASSALTLRAAAARLAPLALGEAPRISSILTSQLDPFSLPIPTAASATAMQRVTLIRHRLRRFLPSTASGPAVGHTQLGPCAFISSSVMEDALTGFEAWLKCGAWSSTRASAPLATVFLDGLSVQGGSGGELAHMLVEAPCDLCAVPEDYSRMGHILLAAGPSAVVAGVLTTYLLQVTGCGKGLLS